MSVIDAIIAKKLCGGGGGSVPKPLTYDYMPEGYPKKTTGIVTVMEEQELEFISSKGVYIAQAPNALGIVEGQTYTVKWDGTEYECICAIPPADRIPVLGNLSIVGAGSDTGEPFIYRNFSDTTGGFITLETTASHTISVKTTEEIITPIAEEFLPAAKNSTTVFYYS